MKKLLIMFVCSLSISAFGQYDKKAKEILDKTSATTKAFQSMKVDFVFLQENIDTKKKSSSQGSLLVKGTKYRIDLLGNTIQCDGKTIWSYVKENNEVNISNVADQEESVFNPAHMFSIYEKGFKYKFLREKFEKNRALYEIELFPEKVDESQYSKLRLLIDKDKMQLFSVEYVAKDANRTTVELQKLSPNVTVNEKDFTFDKSKYPKVEEIDLR